MLCSLRGGNSSVVVTTNLCRYFTDVSAELLLPINLDSGHQLTEDATEPSTSNTCTSADRIDLTDPISALRTFKLFTARS